MTKVKDFIKTSTYRMAQEVAFVDPKGTPILEDEKDLLEDKVVNYIERYGYLEITLCKTA